MKNTYLSYFASDEGLHSRNCRIQNRALMRDVYCIRKLVQLIRMLLNFNQNIVCDVSYDTFSYNLY